jgi:DNA-binding transcriptional ArsR family regulator
MPRSRAHAAQFRQTLALFAIFGHPIRVVMFQRLAKTPMTAGELARTLPVSRTAVVQHLKRMEAQGLAPLRQWLEKHRNKPSTKHPPASTNAGNS